MSPREEKKVEQLVTLVLEAIKSKRETVNRAKHSLTVDVNQRRILVACNYEQKENVPYYYIAVMRQEELQLSYAQYEEVMTAYDESYEF